MFARNYWYVAAFDYEIKRQALLRRILLNEPIAFYRKEDGGPVALEDRCCHRHFPLSEGKVLGNNVQCGYHGLLFNPSGECILVPSQPTIPPGARVKSYPVIERHGLVWVWIGDPAQADPLQIEDGFFWSGDPAWAFKGEHCLVAANYMLMVENLLDLSHLQYVHPTTLGTDGVAAAPIKTERDGDIVRVTRLILDRPAPPFFQKAGGLTAEQRVDRWQIVEFKPPCFIRLDVGCAPTGTGVTEGKRDHGLNLRHHSLMTPETEETHHYFFSEGHSFQIDDPTMTDMIFRNVRIAIMEDVEILKKQQANMKLLPNAPQMSFRQDAAGVQARRLVDSIVAKEQAALRPASQPGLSPGSNHLGAPVTETT